MPYELKKVKKDKFKVCKKDDKKVCFSKKALSKKTALKQKFAIESSERRRFGMGRNTDNIMPKDYNRYYAKYVKKIKKTGLEEFSIGDFINDFNIEWSNTNDTVDEIIDTLVEGTKKYHDLQKQKELDTDDESEEKVRSRSRSRTSSTSMNTEEQNAEVFENYESQLEKYNQYNDEDLELLEFNDFIEKYEEIYDEDIDLEPDTIIEMIIDNQVKEKYGETTDDQKEDIARKFQIASGFEKPDDMTSDFTGEFMFSPSSVVDGKTKDKKISYKSLEKLYDYISGECRKNTKGQYCGWFVDTTNADDTTASNYEELSALTAICQEHIAPRDYNDNWCKDKCSGHVWHFNLFQHRQFGCVFRLQDDGILYLSSGCWIEPHDEYIYIELLCGLGGGKYIMEAFKRLYNQNSEDYFFKRRSGRKYKYLDLSSVNSYITVQFYYKQGLIEDSHVPNDVIEAFKEEIFRQIDERNFDSVEEYCEQYLPYFESGICEPSDTYLDDIYESCNCGGHKYLYPKYDVIKKLGNFEVQIDKNTKLISYNYLQGFIDFCKDAIKNPDQYKQYSREALKKEGRKETVEALLSKAREIRTKRLRTKRMLRNPDLPIQNINRQKNVNTQLRNVTSELEPSGEKSNVSVDVLANKPRFGETTNRVRNLGLKARQEQTAINRLKGNEPRTKYLRRKNFTNFRGELNPIDTDPFETNQQMVSTRVRIPNSRPAKYKIVKSEPPQLAPTGMKNIINTAGDPTGSGVKGTKFYEELKGYGIDPIKYLAHMKKVAKKAGYDEKQLTLDNDDKHKLKISTEQGVKHFGAVGYKDNFIYQHLEKMKKVPKGTAKQMRDRFVKSHGAITTKKKLGRNSANELAIKILWAK